MSVRESPSDEAKSEGDDDDGFENGFVKPQEGKECRDYEIMKDIDEYFQVKRVKKEIAVSTVGAFFVNLIGTFYNYKGMSSKGIMRFDFTMVVTHIYVATFMMGVAVTSVRRRLGRPVSSDVDSAPSSEPDCPARDLPGPSISLSQSLSGDGDAGAGTSATSARGRGSRPRRWCPFCCPRCWSRTGSSSSPGARGYGWPSSWASRGRRSRGRPSSSWWSCCGPCSAWTSARTR